MTFPQPAPGVDTNPHVSTPRLLIYSSLFPSTAEPNAGVFIRERMFRVGKGLPIVVVSPKAWSPFDWLIRKFRPRFRPVSPRLEIQQGIRVYAPRFFSLPGVLKHWDSAFMALGSYFTLKKLQREFVFNHIDAHFGYPDGHAASLLARRFGVPYTVTLRGTEVRHSGDKRLNPKLRHVFRTASKTLSVSDSLRQLAYAHGLEHDNGQVVGNGVDANRFVPVPKQEARRRFKLPDDAQVLITIGGLVERKGFHRVIASLPALLQQHPNLHYLIVGGPCAEGDMTRQLIDQTAALGLTDRVHFLGSMPPDDLKWPLSAADVFVLSTRNEGWANVILEAMACGLPVIASDVGGNKEVVCQPQLGEIIPFDDAAALTNAISNALKTDWDRAAIIAYAQDNSWDNRVETLTRLFEQIQATNGNE